MFVGYSVLLVIIELTKQKMFEKPNRLQDHKNTIRPTPSGSPCQIPPSRDNHREASYSKT